MIATGPIRVMIIDDSATVRKVLSDALGAAPGLLVIGVAADPLFALGKMGKDWPDVIVLDIEMPRMNGITFLRKLMLEHPTPVVICSTLTEAGAPTFIEALAAGATTVIAKPRGDVRQGLAETARELVAAVRAAARANVACLARRSNSVPYHRSAVPALTSTVRAEPLAPARGGAPPRTTGRVIAIGSSTGGTQALEVLLRDLPVTTAGIVIVQHMPEKFTAVFAERLNQVCRIEVREARDGDRVRPGCALIAPGGRHMLLHRSGAQYHVEVREGAPVNRHCPSVDVLFRSAAQCAGSNALGIIMTGMGNDGARGLKEMRDAGARTLAQDEASCVVFGMPKEALRIGAAERAVPLDGIAPLIGSESNFAPS